MNMMHNFQCPRCGNYNIIGESSCKICGEKFVYNCPVCYAPVDNRFTNCPNCDDILYWGFQPDQPTEQETPKAENVMATEEAQQIFHKSTKIKKEKPEGNKKQGKSLLWIILIIICILLIAAVLVIDRFINK